MNRDEIILSFSPVIEKLVLKYNDHQPDEDLEMICWVKVTQAVDRCISENITNYDDIKNRVVRWCINAILNELRVRRNISYTDTESFLEIEDIQDDDFSYLVSELRASLKPKEVKVLDLRLQGFDEEYIKNELQIGNSTYHNIMKNIKKIILN